MKMKKMLVSMIPAGVFCVALFAAGHAQAAPTDGLRQYTDTYTFQSSCTSAKCTATIISGPAPRNPTVPQPVQFTWDGSSWTQVNDFQWDCMMDDGTIQWNPARADVRYTPQPDGSLSGTMHTEILSGPCQGTLEMHLTAQRV